jgi:hypothetical protein
MSRAALAKRLSYTLDRGGNGRAERRKVQLDQTFSFDVPGQGSNKGDVILIYERYSDGRSLARARGGNTGRGVARTNPT